MLWYGLAILRVAVRCRREGEVTQRGASTTSTSSGASVYYDASEELSSTLDGADAGVSLATMQMSGCVRLVPQLSLYSTWAASMQ